PSFCNCPGQARVSSADDFVGLRTNDLVRGVLEFIEEHLERLLPVLVDRLQLEQMLLNLAELPVIRSALIPEEINGEQVIIRAVVFLLATTRPVPPPHLSPGFVIVPVLLCELDDLAKIFLCEDRVLEPGETTLDFPFGVSLNLVQIGDSADRVDLIAHCSASYS